MSEALLQSLEARLGAKGLVRDPETLDRHLLDERKRYKGHALGLALPTSTEEVAATVTLAMEAGVPIVPQGGNTGLCGGATPFGGLLLGLGRMNKIRKVEAGNFTLTADAGCTLQQVQEAAGEADRLFPLSLGAEGTCQIGGNISTNAGGIHVLRYGSMRELVLGIEAVLPSGEIWDGLRSLRKDNTGYDLKQLFIGGEGSLGIVTAASLKLFPRPRARATAYLALAKPADALALLEVARAASGDQVTAIEIMPRNLLALTQATLPDLVSPLADLPPWALILELSGADGQALEAQMETCLAEAYEAGALTDGTIAQNEAQRANFWKWREAIVWARKQAGPGLANDIAVPVSALAAFLESCTPALEKAFPGLRIMPFGHIGDGNLHYNMLAPEGMAEADFDRLRPEIEAAVNERVRSYAGSISAEHGLGRLKAAENERHKPPVEIAMMRAVKQAFDPKGLMNPGVVLS
ncbi:MAG: FAD-binding oxidoreductase [Rhodospirillales bacterium]